MSKDFKIICFKSVFNIIAFSIFIYGHFTTNKTLIILGGCAMLIFSFILFRKILNPLIAIILGVILTFVFTPWYYGLFWGVGVYSILQVISFLHTIKSKPGFLKRGFKVN